jgi:hypothetical protein
MIPARAPAFLVGKPGAVPHDTPLPADASLEVGRQESADYSLCVDTESLVALLAANLVTLAVAAAGFWRQRRGFAHDRELSDLESVRSVMADAAAVLHRMEYALDDALATLRGWGAAFFESEEREKPYKVLEAVGREADLLKGQLRVLFGPEHLVAVAFSNANTAMLDAFRGLWMVKMEPPAERGTPSQQEVREFERQQGERVETARDNFAAAQEQFVKAAHTAGGAKLPPG